MVQCAVLIAPYGPLSNSTEALFLANAFRPAGEFSRWANGILADASAAFRMIYPGQVNRFASLMCAA